jgi:hypothetical protein
VCVCVCSGIWYPHTAVYVLFKTQNWKKKGERYHEGWGGERQKRHGVGSAAVVCVCVSSLAVSF